MEGIRKDREAHGKKPLKEQKCEDEKQRLEETPKPSCSGKSNKNTSRKKQAHQKKAKHQKVNTSDPESGWFRKGEHKHGFAYIVQTSCHANGVVLGYSVHPGNENNGKTIPTILEKLSELPTEFMVGDTANMTPSDERKRNDSTTNRDGYREYKSCIHVCATYPQIADANAPGLESR